MSKAGQKRCAYCKRYFDEERGRYFTQWTHDGAKRQKRWACEECAKTRLPSPPRALLSL